MSMKSPSRTRVILARVAVLLVAGILCITAFEVVGRRVLYWHMLYFVYDVDHRLTPHSAPDVNGDGIRSKVEAGVYREDDLNFVFLGDSFIQGGMVPYDAAIPALFEAKARALHPDRAIRVANFGWVSSSPLLSLRLLRDKGKKYKPDVVVLAVDMTDFQDDLKYAHLLERHGIYRGLKFLPVTIMVLRKLVSRADPIHERIFGFPGRRFFMTDHPLSETRPYFAQIQSSIDAIADYSRNELGARFVLFVLPRCYQYSDRECPKNWEAKEYENLGPYCLEPFTYFEEEAGKVDYPIHSLLPEFQQTTVFPTTFENDPHWNEAGNRIAADAIYEDLVTDGVFRGGP